MERSIYNSDGIAVYRGDGSSPVQVYDHRNGKQLAEIDVGAEEFAFDLSHDKMTLFTTDWKQPRLTKWDANTGRKLETIDVPHRMGQLKLDRTGDRVAFLAPKGFYSLDLRTQEERRILDCQEDLRFSSFSAERNHLLIPMRRKGKIAEIRFDEWEVVVRDLPIDATIRWLQHRPNSETCTVLDSKKCVSCLNLEDSELVWTTPVRKVAGKAHVGVAAHSGNGKLIGAVSSGDTIDVVVIDAGAGEIVNHFEDSGACGRYPYRDSLVLGMYVQKGQPVTAGSVFDLTTGESDLVNLDDEG